MSVFPVVKGVKIRATKVNSCGLPVPGPSNYVVTDGFVTFTASPVMQDAEELEQKNAEGRTCVIDRTPPERKYYNLSLVLCQVNTCLISLFNSWEQEVNYAGDSVGFRDQRRVESDYGVAIEIWTGGKADDDCPVPSDDDIFASAATGKSYGYLLTFGTEWVMGDLEIGAAVSNFTLNGISFDAPQWGRGPWNVVDTDGAGTAGRLITPVGAQQQLLLQRTPIAPPDATPGNECCPLDIVDTFLAPDYYFGGPGGEPAADIAPDQPECTGAVSYTLDTSAVTTNYVLTVDGVDTATIAKAAVGTAIQSAIDTAKAGTGITVTGATSPYAVSVPAGHTLVVKSGGAVLDPVVSGFSSFSEPEPVSAGSGSGSSGSSS